MTVHRFHLMLIMRMEWESFLEDLEKIQSLIISLLDYHIILFVVLQVEMKQIFLRVIYLICILSMLITKDGKLKY